jgi:DNA-directed RNA polymerase specialized sigma24 family protein
MDTRLSSARDVIQSLLTYTDWWQPPTASVFSVGNARRGSEFADGFRSGLLDTLDIRTELQRRVWRLREPDRRLLFLWYVDQRPVQEIARRIGVSRRQCFRRRADAVNAIVRQAENDD